MSTRSPGLTLAPLLALALAAPVARGEAAGAGAAADTLEVTVKAIPGLRFDRVRFQVNPGQVVKLTFINEDLQDDMDHNLVITRPGARLTVVQAAVQAGADKHYVPDIPEVLFATPLVQGGESYELTFTAPAERGAYPYVCTFPGHGVLMYGAMYVGVEMPPLANDENVPPGQRATADAQPPPRLRGVSYGTEFPAVSRTFLPESGPASIAVGLPDGQSYNFDAGVSYLRYAWSGGFVDNTPHWRGNGNAYAIVVGQIYYRNKVGFPLRIGAADSVGVVKFKGYRLVDGGYPEFRYTVDGVEVRELIRSRPDGPGLVRTFEIQTDQPARFVTDPDGGVRFEASAGRWNGSVLELTAAEARRFTVTMIPHADTGGAR
jgi:azurin